MSSPFYLLRTRRFAPLFGTQFLGAFNDNLFKNTLAVLLTFQASTWTSLSPALLAPLIGAVFILPFFLFSGVAGEIADAYDKARLARIVKVWEIFLMVIALIGFAAHSFVTLMIVVFGMGMHSTLFGPIKYSIIPQHMEENELVTANALVESGTFAAILLGTILGGALSAIENGGVIAASAAIAIALIGYGFSRYIPSTPALASSNRFSINIFTQTLHAIRLSYHNKMVFFSILAISWFWLYGALLLSQFPAFVKSVLMGDEKTVTVLLSLFTLGIGIGSLLCERLSNHELKPSLIIVGAIGMGLSGIDFALSAQHFSALGNLYANPEFFHILLDLTLIGVFGGLYSVPLYALIQAKSEMQSRSRIIAANNILNALFMVAGAIVTMILLGNGFHISTIFLMIAMGTLLVAGAITMFFKKSN
ncbi:MAG: MFS transporter [Sulfuricurvum sp. PD_MW2]|jgi:MFS family permease|uniref:MFS transporter n=1 Tax=Sulfuricurvum sp. PD_MW2 TaxID=2027917 RepID=UPI000C0604D9|nr:MFS transporter [Sulfuricurvum sp. PD_MW2]PHM17581.1 MAG: MFS transporter [Sulfuricurvum sp. PD_MW2]